MRPEPDVNYAADPYGYQPPPKRRSGLGVAVAVIAGLGLAGAGAVYYGKLSLRGHVTLNPNGGPPLIEPDPTPTKSRPENPGGIVVPHQDKRVYDLLQNVKIPPDVERLLPPPEEPLPRPLVAPPVPPPVTVTPPQLATVGQEVPQAGQAAQPPAPAPVSEPAPTTAAPTPIVPAAKPNPAAKSAAPATPAKPVPAPPAATAPTTTAAAPPPAKETPAKPAAAPPAASGGWRIQLASVRSEDDAKAEWHRLVARFPTELGGLTFQASRIDFGGDKGVYIRVQGLAASEDQARSACEHLRTQRVGCVLVRP